jgi:hypothetical protein
MSEFSDDNLRKAIKARGNPYAFIDFDKEEALELQRVAASVAAAPHPMVGAQDSSSAIVRALQNPYANEFYRPRVDSASDVPVTQGAGPAIAPSEHLLAGAPVDGLSKRDFEIRCRLVFARYIPASERGKLRRHHREFVARNSSRPARHRAALVKELKKYDISDTIGIAGQFNREDADITEGKLRRIERIVEKALGDDE